jgi:Holliday junction DNA helicase RuvA
MIARLTGQLADEADGIGVFDVRGVGYAVAAPRRAFARWRTEGESAVAYVVTVVREDDIALHGFDTPADRAAFAVLIGVSGIGPRLAHAALDAMDAGALQRALDTEDVVALSRVPGIGRKTAQRMVLELKGKLVPSIAVTPAPRKAEDPLVLALAQLEYGRSEIERALSVLRDRGVAETAPLETRLRDALRVLADR